LPLLDSEILCLVSSGCTFPVLASESFLFVISDLGVPVNPPSNPSSNLRFAQSLDSEILCSLEKLIA